MSMSCGGERTAPERDLSAERHTEWLGAIKVGYSAQRRSAGSVTADPTTRGIPSESAESSGSSIRLTPAGGTPPRIRGKLPVPARVFPWERGLLSTIVDDLLQDLIHAANKNDDSDP